MSEFIFSEYARPHSGFSPGGMPRSAGPAVLGLPPQCMDPMLQYHLSNMYGPGTRERYVLQPIIFLKFAQPFKKIFYKSH